ncbi:hypothetical protein [Methylorubrum thiocyanatum]|uniref:hypothetical protein n=1 Tax=Methylorubrum thiocyanatum TaxID=47958 RepID=UPI003F803FC3
MRNHIDPDLASHVGLVATGHSATDKAALSVVAEAILAQREGRFTSYSRRKNSYTGMTQYGGPSFTHANVTRAVDHVASLGLIELHAGFWRSDGSGCQSTFAATPMLASLGDAAPRILVRSGTNLILKDKAKFVIPYKTTIETRRLSGDLSAWTESVRGSDIRLDAPDVTWVDDGAVSVPHGTKGGGPITISVGDFEFYRVFNDGAFSQGGRAYGHWSQSLPSARRAEILIDAEPVALLDYSASHPRILYAQAGIPLDGDPYEVDGFERDMAKVGLLVVLNAVSRRQGIEAMAHKIAGERIVNDSDRKTAKGLLEALEARHAPISGQFYRGTGLACQRIEADILADVARQARKEGIVTLPVHDEMIAKARHGDRVTELMQFAWRKHLGADPVVKAG